MVSPILSEADHDRLEAAVAAAERRTTGEIVCVLTREVSTYPEVPVAAGAVAALAPVPILLALGYDRSPSCKAWPADGGWATWRRRPIRPARSGCSRRCRSCCSSPSP